MNEPPRQLTGLARAIAAHQLGDQPAMRPRTFSAEVAPLTGLARAIQAHRRETTRSLRLTALHAPAGVSTGLPSRLKLLSWGENPSVKGVVRVSQLSAELLPQNQRERGFTEIALDFEHNTVPGSPEYERSQEPRKVAAYGSPRVVRGEGLYLENLRWTPIGQTEAPNFLDLSPAVEMDAQGNVLFVHSAALTRNGAVHGLEFRDEN